MNGTGLIRPPSSRLADGIVTHISRTPVDVALALTQHAAYADALAASALGLRTVRIIEPGVLKGGDVLQVGTPVYVGRGGRTNGEGIRQLRALLAPLGRTVIAVPLGRVLHLKSAVTALPDGTFLLLPELVPAGLFPAVRPVTEERAGAIVHRIRRKASIHHFFTRLGLAGGTLQGVGREGAGFYAELGPVVEAVADGF